MSPTPGNNFLLSFDYKLPALQNGAGAYNILYIHSTRPEHSNTALSRLMQLNSSARFSILKRPDVFFPGMDGSNAEYFSYEEKFLPADFYLSEDGKRLKESQINLLFFCINLEITASINLLEIKAFYNNLFECVNNLGLSSVAYVIDKKYKVFPLEQLNIDSWTRTWEVKDKSLDLPWTLLSLQEKEELFELARSGPGEGAIVNIGHFLGGSSIILAKGSKERGREKVYSFDIKEYALPENLFARNDVDDWIVFTEKKSEQAAREWGKRKNTAIRLLFIDGDHSYEGCRSDILNWIPYLVPGGVVAIHDYCNISEGVDFAMIVKAVYETLLTDGRFGDFKRTDTLFSAIRK